MPLPSASGTLEKLLGRGKDYLYHGTTTFRGVNTGDVLKITTKDKEAIRMRTPEEIFPEYFLIRVNMFNEKVRTHLEEWLDYLKNDRIREDTTAPGLQEARKKLQYMKMDPKERKAYERHMENLMYQDSVFDAAHLEGWEEGRAKGRAEGRAEGELEKQREIAARMKQMNLSIDAICQATGLDKAEVERL